MVKKILKKIVNTLNLVRILKNIEIKSLRFKTDTYLNGLADTENSFWRGTVLLDAAWDNPNYWARYTVLRRALGLKKCKEIALLGTSRRSCVQKTLAALNVDQIIDYHAIDKEIEDKVAHVTKGILREIEITGNLWDVRYPYDIPAEIFYDYVLKKQRRHTVDVEDEKLPMVVTMFFRYLFTAEKVLEDNPDVSLLVTSHVVGRFFPLVWLCINKGIKVVNAFANNGQMLYWQISSLDHIFGFMSNVRAKDLAAFSDYKRELAVKIGKKYLTGRLDGNITHVGAYYAYGTRYKKMSREEICRKYGWNAENNLVAVYASNWFDFPHTHGMKNFKDFYDWILTTVDVAKKNPQTNWVFKPHPCDDWYGGLSLEDILEIEHLPNVRIMPKDWKGPGIMTQFDAIITCHGTIGIEASALGVPVLVADKGWYHDWGFVEYAGSKDEYMLLINKDWWKEMPVEENIRKAYMFAGFFWGRPEWQKSFIFDEDTHQNAAYKNLVRLFSKNLGTLNRECLLLQDWIQSQESHYHVYKLKQAETIVFS